jgi:hypothetical protein
MGFSARIVPAIVEATMHAVIELLSAWTSWLSRMLLVTPEFITKDRRGNVPPPSGGIGAY